MRFPFRILNVFTIDGDRLSGNPLCVFEDASALTDLQMQGLARQMNLSETTFILPGTIRQATARVRIFTPGFEMPFAGHPTLGTAFVVSERHPASTSIVLEMKAGNVPVTVDGNQLTLRVPNPPITRKVAATRAELAAMLSLPAEAITEEPLWVSTGVEQLVIPLGSAAHVRAAKPVPALIESHGLSEARNEAMAYVWAAAGRDLVVRFFFTQHGAVIEDPATGSACANLGGWMLATGKALPVAATLAQGAAVGRPSRLHLRVEADRSIYVSGSVIELGRGTLDL